MSRPLVSAEERDQARTKLRELFPAESYVTTVRRHRSQSGTTHAIQVLAISEGLHGPQIDDVSWLVRKATGRRMNARHGGLTVQGGGMNPAVDLVHSLGLCLYPDHTGGMALRVIEL